MDPALYYRIYGEGIDEQVILRHIRHVKTYHLYSIS